MSIEAMNQALEALEECRRDPRLKYEHLVYDKTITALRTAIAEADKHEAWEPSDTAYRPGGLPQDFIVHESENQEPVADGLIRGYVNALVANKPDEAADATKRMVDYVFATPPAAQWVGLTEAEINEWDYDVRDVVMDIEKLLREKNT